MLHVWSVDACVEARYLNFARCFFGVRASFRAQRHLFKHSAQIGSCILSREISQHLDQWGNQRRPARLVTRTNAHAGVTVEALVEEDEITPPRIALEARFIPEHGPRA